MKLMRDRVFLTVVLNRGECNLLMKDRLAVNESKQVL